MATESQNLPFACLPRLYFLLSAIVALHLSRVLYKSTLFMQNKPNLPAPQMNVSSVSTKDYESQGRLQTPGKQTQSNPISSEFLSQLPDDINKGLGTIPASAPGLQNG